MYVPKHFEEADIAALYALMRAYPLATLVTLDAEGLTANHIPFFLDANAPPSGRLQAHVARANPVWKSFSSEVETLAIFQGPDAYISPSWYATKQETGKVVPTWNYSVVHAYGTLRVVDDPAWVRTNVENLTVRQEAGFAEPWSVSDAPRDYTEKLIGAIVGIELTITRLVGKRKTSQNQPPANREGVVRGLEGLETDAAQAMAALIPKSD